MPDAALMSDVVAAANEALDRINRADSDAPQQVAVAISALENHDAHWAVLRWLARRRIRGHGSWRAFTQRVWAERRKLLAERQTRTAP